MKKYIAEFLGTYTLSLVVLLSVAGVTLNTTPALAAITLGLFVYIIGSISGCHINPAVSFALWVLGKMKQNEMLNYVVSQLAGAVVALGTAWLLVDNLSQSLSFIQDRVGADLIVGLGESLGAFIFGFGIMSVVSGKVQKELSGIIIGGSLFLGIIVAGSVSNGILNPAVALALGSIDLMYIVGPLVGMVFGMRICQYLVDKSK